MNNLTDILTDIYEQNANPKRAVEMSQYMRNLFPFYIIDLFGQMIVTDSWWDSVDFIATKLISFYFKKWPAHQKKFVDRWIESNNMWLNRTAIIYQLKYKQDTDTDLLFSIIRKHSSSNEFFIQKATGWALREYAYTDSECVKDFVASHQLKPLRKREALKRM